tara:strand:+ start:429 stop:737 length:309 start_codon:yes stop_codon:yes gene_type:complete
MSAIQQLQLTQQNLQNIVIQKQQLQSQLVELNSALTELKTTEKSYRIVGKLMIATPKDKLSSELEDKREAVEVRLKNFNSQEEKLKEKIEELQKKAMDEMKK